eukprot:TRINITY_DN15305_c0_g1_i1.p1 TRINITY_DN15305_c0_g1~~TRINITY_DN15305_c0_g1_i1.p1  ORF type:complete len:534 (+),score=90.98 TRINITY_DN15305_c0_g1_i1:167-1768(+)
MSGDQDDEENPRSDEKPISVRRRMNALFINLLLVSTYLAVGGAIVSAIELPGEKKAREQMWESMQTMYISGGNSLGGSTDAAKAFREQLNDNLGCGIKEMSHDYDFDFTGSIFFALTVVTTIGYGNFTPVTKGGRVFVVLYSILGISLILNFMFQASYLWLWIVKGLGQRFCGIHVAAPARIVTGISFNSVNTSKSGEVDAKELRAVLQKLAHTEERLDESIIAYCFMKADPQRTGRLDETGLLNAISVFLQIWPTIPKGADIKIMGVAFVLIGVWTFVWGSAIGSKEGWSLSESLWYGFVSLTTIGFGDYAPESHMGRIQAFLFIFVGLGMVAWLVSSVTEVWSKFSFWRFQRMYEEGKVSEKWMDIRGYVFKSPLGIPSRQKIGPFVSKKPPRTATLPADYVKTINSENPGPKRDPSKVKVASPLVAKKKSGVSLKEKEKQKEKQTPVAKTAESSIEVELELEVNTKGAEYQELKEEPEKKAPAKKKKSSIPKPSEGTPPSSPAKKPSMSKRKASNSGLPSTDNGGDNVNV